MGDYEIIAIDNDSSDDSAGRLGRYPITIIRESKPGSYAARNAGMRIAQGELLAFTDSDCAPRKDWLSTIVSALSDPSILLVQGKRLPNSNSDLMQAINAYELRKDELILGGSDPRKFYGYTNNMGMRRTTWDEFGPFVERNIILIIKDLNMAINSLTNQLTKLDWILINIFGKKKLDILKK